MLYVVSSTHTQRPWSTHIIPHHHTSIHLHPSHTMSPHLIPGHSVIPAAHPPAACSAPGWRERPPCVPAPASPNAS